jgi:hypothetical protein
VFYTSNSVAGQHETRFDASASPCTFPRPLTARSTPARWYFAPFPCSALLKPVRSVFRLRHRHARARPLFRPPIHATYAQSISALCVLGPCGAIWLTTCIDAGGMQRIPLGRSCTPLCRTWARTVMDAGGRGMCDVTQQYLHDTTAPRWRCVTICAGLLPCLLRVRPAASSPTRCCHARSRPVIHRVPQGIYG